MPDPHTQSDPTPETPADLNQRIAELSAQLEESHQTITALERRQRIDALLREADPVDLDAVRLLTEAAVAQMDDADVELAVSDLRQHKPDLFRPRKSEPLPRKSEPRSRKPSHGTGDTSAPPGSPAMAPRSDVSRGPRDDAAARAAVTGDRRDLLAYLRLKRERT